MFLIKSVALNDIIVFYILYKYFLYDAISLRKSVMFDLSRLIYEPKLNH
jgi:hypothetical protein